MQPLAAYSVFEASGDIATRYCGRLFSLLGARVVRVRTGDDAMIGYTGEQGQAFGRWLDQDKSVIDDASSAQGPFDLVIGGQDAPGVAAAQALAEAMENRPSLLAITWFDLGGPYGDWRGTDEVINALTGVAFGFGEREGPPVMAQGHAPQIVGGLTGVIAALSSWFDRPVLRPARIESSIYEACMCFMETGSLGHFFLGGMSTRLGVNKFAPTYPSSSYETSDGWVGITALTPSQWSACARMIGRPELGSDPRYASTIQRLIASVVVDEYLRPAFRTKSTAEWVAIGDASRVPTTPMPTPAQMPHVPHWRDRGAFAPIGEGDVLGPRLPFRFRFDGAPRPRWSQGEGQGPLSGLRVVDFGMGWAGPLCGRHLADLGATVIKIESETHPDWWRGWEPADAEITARESKLNFIDVNRNKLGVDLDLTSPEGLAATRRLIASADVVLENYAAGVMEKLGLSQATLRALNPGLINLSMPAMGNGGPLSGLRAYGSTVEQACGLPHVNGQADWPPCLQHVAYGDPVAGLFGAASILTALAGRERLGGADIDMAQVECLFQLGGDSMVAAQLDPDLPRTGSARARLALCAVVPGRGEEAWLMVAAREEDLEALEAVIGGRDPAALAAWAADREPLEAAKALQGAGLAAAPVQPASCLCFDEHLCASEFWPAMERAFVGEHLIAAAPYRFDGARPALRITAPVLGEHTAQVLAELD
jgi:crotonobetainyl-CoA:carnitine CoA-transferase CaiB-like acyl-CoA transferase